MAASKACLLPFLTLYLKKLGLSATQTGLVIGAKTFVGLLFAPLWSRCAVRSGRRRFMLMFSLFAMGATYLSITAVPSMDDTAFASKCTNLKPVNVINSHASGQSVLTTTTTSTLKTVTHLAENGTLSDIDSSSSGNLTLDNGDEGPLVGVTSPSSGSQTETSKTKLTTRSKSMKTPTPGHEEPDNKKVKNTLREILVSAGMREEEVANLNIDEMSAIINNLMSSENGRYLLSVAVQHLSDEARETLQSLSTRTKRDTADSDDGKMDENSGSVLSRLSNKLWRKLSDFRKEVKNAENHMFIVLIVILTVGEALSSPIEKIADDGWFEFLESIDDIEKYGMQRIWSSFAYMLLPLIVTLVVDNTTCLFGQQVHPFMFHFVIFGFLLILTFLFAFCYPMASSDKYKYASKVAKGMNIICCNFRSLMFVITLLITGAVYSSYYNFLFWFLDDMGSGEITMGMCLTLAALAEIPMLLFNDKIIRKIGNGGIVALSLLFLSARCLYYSFLTTPWAVLPAELSHAFTHTALWWGILSSPSFNTSPALSRSIRSILSTVYFGMGFALGSALSGVIYDEYGVKTLFQAGAVIAIAWFPVLSIGVRCCRERDESQAKYKRLLTSDDASGTDSEDDWLDQALKDR